MIVVYNTRSEEAPKLRMQVIQKKHVPAFIETVGKRFVAKFYGWNQFQKSDLYPKVQTDIVHDWEHILT